MRPLHPRHGIHAPTRSTPPRAPGTLRRTSTTDMLRPEGLRGPLVLEGRARDLWTDARGSAHVLGEAGYRASVAYTTTREVTAIHTEPERSAAQQLVGVRAASGFRAALDAALPAEREARSLLYLLLDDLPVASLISGHALSYASAQPRVAGRQVRLQQADLCSGWRTGGTLLVELEETGSPPVATGPEAPPLLRADDPLAWHALPPLPMHGMRRHRRLDLASAETLRLDVLLRDVHHTHEARECIVHEYALTAELDPATLVFRRVDAQARVLPWRECDSAGASASRLVGRPADGLRAAVRADFTGTSTCTHLNDTLRSLEDVAALAQVLARLGR